MTRAVLPGILIDMRVLLATVILVASCAAPRPALRAMPLQGLSVYFDHQLMWY